MASEWEHNHLRQTDEHIRAAKSYICREERLIERLNRTWMWTSGYNGHIRRATYGDARGRDGGVRQELAAQVVRRKAPNEICCYRCRCTRALRDGDACRAVAGRQAIRAVAGRARGDEHRHVCVELHRSGAPLATPPLCTT